MVDTCEVNKLTNEAPTRSAPEVTLVVPTFNERDNIAPLLDLVAHALQGISGN